MERRIPMFVVFPKNPIDWQSALFILSYYHVITTLRSDGDDAASTYMVVEEDPENPDGLRMAEMAFQMNWKQSLFPAHLCPDCVDHADRLVACGHLTFTSRIKPAF
jgi:hypothetical protein